MRSLQVGPNLHDINAQNEKQRKEKTDEERREHWCHVNRRQLAHSACEQLVRCAPTIDREIALPWRLPALWGWLRYTWVRLPGSSSVVCTSYLSRPESKSSLCFMWAGISHSSQISPNWYTLCASILNDLTPLQSSLLGPSPFDWPPFISSRLNKRLTQSRDCLC